MKRRQPAPARARKTPGSRRSVTRNVVQMLVLLGQSRAGVTLETFRAETGVSRRTVYRMLSEIAREVPLAKGVRLSDRGTPVAVYRLRGTAARCARVLAGPPTNPYGVIGRVVPGEEELGPQRRCPKCGDSWPLTAAFWVPDAASPIGFRYWCRGCFKGRTYAGHRRPRRKVPAGARPLVPLGPAQDGGAA